MARGRLPPVDLAQARTAEQSVQLTYQRILLLVVPVAPQAITRLRGGGGRREDDIQEAENTVRTQYASHLGACRRAGLG